MGVWEPLGDNPAAVLARATRGREFLLVLDNFEHLLPASDILGQLLAQIPGLRMLVTSRAPVRIAGEHVFEVPPLTLPAEVKQLDSEALLRTSESARLFVTRAREARPDFRLTDENCSAVAAACRTLEGLPLAIELAAARVRHVSVTELAKRLDSRLALLSRGRPDMPHRHQSVRAAIDASYDLLGADEQAVFGRLAAFAGGFELPAAEAVCGEELDVLEGISTLIDNSLIRRGLEDGDDRYGMLEVVREYARERLDHDADAPAVRARHADFFVG